MLRQICRRGRLSAFVHDVISMSKHTNLKAALSILVPKLYLDAYSDQSENTSAKKLQAIPDDDYCRFLLFFGSSEPIRHFNQFPHPDNARILSPMAVPKTHIQHKTRTYSTLSIHRGNSSISFYPQNSNNVEYGQIEAIWTHEINGGTDLLLVSAYHKLSDEDHQTPPLFCVTRAFMHCCILGNVKKKHFCHSIQSNNWTHWIICTTGKYIWD